VEICALVKAVKYIHKYIYKEPDQAILEIQNVDKLKEYVDSNILGLLKHAGILSVATTSYWTTCSYCHAVSQGFLNLCSVDPSITYAHVMKAALN